MSILSFGEVVWDLYPHEKFLGGAPLNFAAHLAKHGESVFLLSALGKDPLGKEAEEQIKKWKIHTDYICYPEGKETGKCMVTLDENSVPSYLLLEDVAYDYITCALPLDACDVLYFGTLALRSGQNRITLKKILERGSFREVFVDVNVRMPFFSAEVLRFSLETATILKISLEELPAVASALEIPVKEYKAFAKALSERYPDPRYILITLGEEGVYALETGSKKEFFCQSPKVSLRSTVGAGDSFSAAFLHQYLQEKEISYCLDYAARVAAFVVSVYEAVPDYHAEDFS